MSGVEFLSGTRLVSCGGDGYLRVWDAATGDCVAERRDAQPAHAPRRLHHAEGVAVPAPQALRVGRRRDRGAVSTYGHGDAALVVGAAQRRRRARAPEHGAAADADDERVA